MELDLPYGPWKRLSLGEWGGYPTAIYSNPDRLLLLAVFEAQEGDVKGVLTMVKKAYVTTADVGKAAKAQKREFTVIEKHSVESSRRYVLVSSQAAYSPYSPDELANALGKQISEVRATGKAMEELAQAYGSPALDLAKAGDDEMQSLLGDPFLLLAMLDPQAAVKESSLREARALIGVNAAGEAVNVPLSALAKTVILGGDEAGRLHAMHVLCEAALTNGVPCVVFDSTRSFAGLQNPNPKTQDFPRFRMSAMPLGFPLKEYKLGNGFYVDLALVDASLFTSTMGLSGTQAGKVIEAAWKSPSERHALSDLMDAVAKQPETAEFTAYEASKAARALKIIEKTYPATFAKLAEASLLIPWQDSIGRVFRVDASSLGDAAQHLAISSLVRAIPKQKARRLKAVLAFENGLSQLYSDVLERADELSQSGIAMLVHADHELDVQLLGTPTLKLELVGTEAVMTVEGGKPARFSLRPAYTECTEKTLAAPAAARTA